MKQLLGNDQQQIVTDGNPYLRKDCILRRSEERLDMQVLLDPLEEQLYLPTLPIEFCNCECVNGEVVCQESIHVVRGIVFIDNHTYHLWIVLGDECPCEPDTLVADESCMHIYRSFFNHFEAHVVLCPCDEVCLSEMVVVVEPPEVHIAFVHQVIRSCFNRQYVKAVHVIDLPLRHPDECRNGASQVKKCVHLHGTAVSFVFRPWTKLQAKLYGTAVKSIDHLVKTKSEIIVLVQSLGPCYQHHSKVTVYLPVLRLVHVGESGLGDEFHPGMIELGGEHCQRRFDVTKACTIGELGIDHHTELVTAGELQSMEVSIVFVNTFLELILWNQIHQLREDGFSDRHNESKLDKYYIQQNEIFIEKFTNRHNKLNVN